MRGKVSWTGWKKQFKQYVASGTKVLAVEVNEGNGKDEKEVYAYNDHDVGDLGTEPSSSCEDVTSDDATSRREEKAPSCIKANIEEFARSRLSPLTPPISNPRSAPQISPPTPSRSNPASAVGSALTKGAFKHVYRSGPVRRLSSRTTSGANDIGAQGQGSRNCSGEEMSIAATTIQAAFRVHRSRRSSSEDTWSEGFSSTRRLEKELGQTKVAGTFMSPTDARRDLPSPAAEKNINGDWDTDTRLAADCEASAQLKHEGAIKRARTREYAHTLRRLRYGLEQNNNKGARGLQADEKVLDKPGYVMNWLQRAQRAPGDKHVLSDATIKLPSGILSPNTGIANGSKKKKPNSKSRTEKENPKSSDKTSKPPNSDKEKKLNMNGDCESKPRDLTQEATAHTPLGGAEKTGNRAYDHGMEKRYFQNQSSSSPPVDLTTTTTVAGFQTPNQEARRLSTLGNGTTTITASKTTATNNKNDRRRGDTVGGHSTTAAAAARVVVVAPTEQHQRRLSSSPFAGLKTSITSTGNPKKLPFKI